MISFEEYCGPCGCGDRACGAWGGGPWYCGPVGCAPGGLLGGGGLAWAARGALARPSRTKARAIVRVMVSIECSIGNRGSAVPVKVLFIRQDSHWHELRYGHCTLPVPGGRAT